MRKVVCSLLFIMFVLAYHTAISQKVSGKISGTLYSDSTHCFVTDATITLVNFIDSTVEKIVVPDKKGHFSFNGLRLADYILSITAINYVPINQRITLIDDKREVSLDSFWMKFTADSLASVTVTGYKTAVVLKTDTIEFNAGSFKVKENAAVEDLLKKLPGVMIMKDGSIQAQGEKITQVFVDGKPFFGNDPKIVTQNLPANIVDKVQLIDKKSEEAIATKVEDGVREKVLNITIKKDKNRGVFGRIYTGYGTNERYEARVSANYFNKDRKISFVTGGNNTGRNDYGSGDNESTSYNNNNGLTKNFQSKISYTDKWSKLLDVNANVGYSNNTNTNEQVKNRENIFGDSINYYYEKSHFVRSRSGINAGIGFEYKPDTLTNIRFTESANFGKSANTSSSTYNSSLNSFKLNEGSRTNSSTNKSPSLNGNLSYSRRFTKERRAVFFNLNNNINNSLGDGLNLSNNYFFPSNAVQYQLLQNQFLSNDTRSSSINSSASYSEPVSKKGTINISTAYNININNALREAFNFNNNTGIYDLFNDTLSNVFKNRSYNTSIGANYNYALKRGNVSVGATWQDAKTKSRSVTKNTLYLQHFSGFVPYFGYNYNNKGKRFGINYNFSNRAPQAYQLQPLIDNSNPLYIRLGNPNLKYATNHRFNLNFNSYNAKSQASIHGNTSVSFTANNFSISNIYDKVTGRQTSQPINVNGVYSGNVNFGYTKQFKALNHSISWSNNASVNVGRNVSLINYERNINQTIGSRISTGLEYELEDVFQLEIKPSVNIQSSRFSLKPDLNNNYYTYNLEYNIEVDFGKLTELMVDGELTRNTGRSAGFNQNFHTINIDLTQYLNAKKSFWLKLKVYDLLKQNLNFYRYSGESYIEDGQTTVLTRFFLLSFNAKLSKFKGNKG